MEDWTCLGQHKRQPEFPVVTRESRRNSRKTTWLPRHRKMKPCAATASQEKSHFRNWSSKRYLSPLMRPTKCPDIPVSLERNTEVFRQHFLWAPSTLLISTGGSTPLLCLEGVPDLPVAPQNEAGLTTTFQTWPRAGLAVIAAMGTAQLRRLVVHRSGHGMAIRHVRHAGGFFHGHARHLHRCRVRIRIQLRTGIHRQRHLREQQGHDEAADDPAAPLCDDASDGNHGGMFAVLDVWRLDADQKRIAGKKCRNDLLCAHGSHRGPGPMVPASGWPARL